MGDHSDLYSPGPGGYAVENGTNEVGGGRSQGMSHSMAPHHQPMYISPHIMSMPGPTYIQSVPASHQLHMQGMNTHGHLATSSGSSLRTSSELPMHAYSQAQNQALAHRNAPVFHTPPTQQGQLASGPSSSSTGQPRVQVPMQTGNMSSQWPWPPPAMSGKVPAMSNVSHAHMSTPSAAQTSSLPQHVAPSAHGLTSNVQHKQPLSTASSAWGTAPPRGMMAAAGSDARYRAPASSSPTVPGSLSAMNGGSVSVQQSLSSQTQPPTSPNKYSASTSISNANAVGGLQQTSPPSSSSGLASSQGVPSSQRPSVGVDWNNPPATITMAPGSSQSGQKSSSMASFVNSAKSNYFNYTPSTTLSGSAGTSGVAGFQDASVYVPSSQGTGSGHGHGQSTHTMHAASQHLTSSHHHINRAKENALEEYVTASLRRRMLKANSPAVSGTSSPSVGPSSSSNRSATPTATTTAPGTSSTATPNGSAAKEAALLASPSKGAVNPSAGSSQSYLNTNSHHSSTASSTTDTTNWQVLDMSAMALPVVSPQVAMYSQISALYLKANRLVSLPVELCTLANLKFLDLSYNALAWLPAEIGQLLSLKELLLDHNQLRSLPVEIGKLFRLNELTIEENPIADIPQDVLQGGAGAVVAHYRNLLAPSEPPPPRPWFLSATADRTSAPPGYFQGLDSILGPKAVRTLESGHKQVSIQAKDVAQFRIEGSIRTMCYNILADIYASSLNYCPNWALNWNHRKNVVLKEIELYAPDLLCLQEVVWAQYLHFFQPELERRGYKSVFHPKTRVKYSQDANRVDGCASFYRATMFEEVTNFSVEFQTIAQDYPDRYCTPGDDAGYVRLISKDNIGVGLILRRRDRSLPPLQQARQVPGATSKYQATSNATNRRGSGLAPVMPSPEEDLVVFVNTHIHWDPDFSDVKLMQVQMLLEHLEDWVEEYSSANYRIPLILGGDFNSMPDSGVYDFLVNGYLSGDHPEFLGYTYGVYTDEGLRHSFQLSSSNAAIAGEPAFTNYTGDFNGVLDYIWYSDDCLTVERALGGVDESVVHAYNGALPNPHMPSDHIPLVSDFVSCMNRRG